MFKYVTVLWLVVTTQVLAVEVSLNGVTDDLLASNIKAHLSNLNTKQQCEIGADLEATIDSKLETASNAVGYYHLKVTSMTVTDTKFCDELELNIEQGEPVVINQITVAILGDGEQDPEFQTLLKNLPISQNKILVHHQYESAKRRFDSIALSRGYFDGKFEKQSIQIDTQRNTAHIELQYNSGVRYQFGELIGTRGLRAESLIRDVMTFAPGDPYHVTALGELNQNLRQTGYFQQVVARPLVKQAQNAKVPIEIIATSKARDIFNLGGGASTDTGPRVKLNWQRPWVNMDGHSMSADLFVSGPKQSLSFRYKIPVEDPLDSFFTLQAGYKAEDDNDTNSNAITLAAQRHWKSTDKVWNRIAFLRYERETFQQADEPQQTTDLLIPGFTVSRHRSRGGLDANWGDQQLLTIEVAEDSFISDIDLLRVTVQTKWLRSFGDHRLFMRAKVGGLTTSDFTEVPSSLRYFAGGDQSVRGFGYQQLAPREGEDDELVGGKYLNTGSIEYSYPVAQDWRMALFVDAGNASNKPMEKLAYSSGLGASWLSPVGPIRFYIARGFSDFENTIRFHFSMGPVL